MRFQPPEQLIVNYLYRYAGQAVYNQSSKAYNAGCPVCREGNSWGRKKRLFYVTEENYLYCHNCQRSWSPLDWACEVSGKTKDQVMLESTTYSHFRLPTQQAEPKKIERPPLPSDSINLSDQIQTSFYAKKAIVKDSLDFIKRRRLDTARNKVDLYLSLTDFIHKDRICIPFRDTKGSIIFYQTRAIYKKDEDNGKYLSKMGADKSVFNVEKIELDYPYVFIFEGPINSMFIRNGVGMAGLTFTELQESQLAPFITHKKIWVLDNQWVDEAARVKSRKLAKQGQHVFIWPKQLSKYKDLNDLCMDLQKDEINPNFIIDKTVDSDIMFDFEMSKK